MSAQPVLLSRRTLCAGTVLGAGLAVTGLAEAKKREFRVIYDFGPNEAPTTYPVNTDDGHGEHNRLNIITCTHGWRFDWNVGGNGNDAFRVHSRTCSHLIELSGHAEGGGFWPKIYGTETLGGKHGSGSVIWWYISNRHYIHDLYTFDPDGTSGLHPMGGLIEGFDGAMYGTTHEGGANGVGTIFRITTDGSLSVLHHFDPLAGEGFRPTQAPTAGPDGNYYGATESGGVNYQGSLYRMAPDGAVATLHSFDFVNDGAMPHAAVTLSPDGLLYGVTQAGGEHGGGTLFSLAPDGTVSVLHHFGGIDGTTPIGSLYALADGTLYGTCSQGGAFNRGTVFKFLPARRKLVVRHHFASDGSDGATPMAGFCLATNGYLYSTARDAGPSGGGTLFSIAP